VVLSIANAIWYRSGGRTAPDVRLSEPGLLRRQNGRARLHGPADRRPHQRLGRREHAWPNQTDYRRAGVPDDAQVILANAIYFKGSWERKFDPKATKERAFHLRDGRQPQVPMMQQSGEFQYQEGNGCQAVRLPYAGRRLEMCVLLPAADSSIEKLLAAVDGQVWQSQVRRQFSSRRGSLVLPRFKLEYGAELKQPLAALGMRLPFSRGADFSGMSTKPLYLSQVKHQSFVEVNEEGTEAAAVTRGIMRSLSVQRPTPPFEMIVDRPFLFVIEDNLANAILFIGVVFDPTSPS
jgi:serine protease inhibitor